MTLATEKKESLSVIRASAPYCLTADSNKKALIFEGPFYPVRPGRQATSMISISCRPN